MYLSYFEDLTLERRKVNKGYSPGNCLWVTRYEQGLNKQNTIRIKIGRKILTVIEWAYISGESYKNIYSRLRRGWNGRDSVFGRCPVRRLTDGERILIIKRWEQGITRRKIGDELGVWHSTVNSVIFRHRHVNK